MSGSHTAGAATDLACGLKHARRALCRPTLHGETPCCAALWPLRLRHHASRPAGATCQFTVTGEADNAGLSGTWLA